MLEFYSKFLGVQILGVLRYCLKSQCDARKLDSFEETAFINKTCRRTGQLAWDALFLSEAF